MEDKKAMSEELMYNFDLVRGYFRFRSHHYTSWRSDHTLGDWHYWVLGAFRALFYQNILTQLVVMLGNKVGTSSRR